MKNRRRLLITAALCLAVMAAGCGQGTGTLPVGQTQEGSAETGEKATEAGQDTRETTDKTPTLGEAVKAKDFEKDYDGLYSWEEYDGGNAYNSANSKMAGGGILKGMFNGITGANDAMVMTADAVAEEAAAPAAEEGYAEPADGYVPEVTAAIEPYDEGDLWLKEQLPDNYNTSEFSAIKEKGFTDAMGTPLSTFGADVDTASYCIFRQNVYYAKQEEDKLYYMDNIRNSLRVEEALNYFDYGYDKPEDGDKFSVTSKVAPCPWSDNLLLMVGIKAEEYKAKNEGSNVVLLVDTSGSMFDNNKLPLAQKAIRILADKFNENDRISIVTYAGSQEVLLSGVSGDRKKEIEEAVNGMEAGGFTDGGSAIQTAYDLASKNLIEGGNNRVILMTDGDFNVGQTSEAELVSLIESERDRGIFLSICGFGDYYSDTRMEALADNGNGNYDFIDCSREAERFFNKEFDSTMYTMAKDVKFQLDFNPAKVKAYRKIGYENREMAAEDFRNDLKDGGEVGSGQTVTILYELIPAGSEDGPDAVSSDYVKTVATGDSDAYCTVRIRYKEPDAQKAEEKEYKVTDLEKMDDDMSFAAGVAQVIMLARGSEYAGTSTYDSVMERLSEVRSNDDFKAEFLFITECLKELEKQDK